MTPNRSIASPATSPGAINIPFAGNLRDGSFLAPADLADRFASVIDDPNPIVHCGSGVTACHNALAMEAAGLPLPRVYVGSWSGLDQRPRPPDRHRADLTSNPRRT